MLNENLLSDRVWIGGRSETENIWQWADGSEWGIFQKWSHEALRNGEETSDKCLLLALSYFYRYTFDWEVAPCTQTFPFICKFPKTPMKKLYEMPLSEMGNRIHFWMQLKDVAAEQLHEKGKMPGFSFSWRVEGEREVNTKDWEVEVNHIGRRIESPGWRDSIKEVLDDEKPIYKASILTGNLVEEMGDEDTLVIELEIENGVVVIGKGGPTESFTLPLDQYVIHEDWTSWGEAEEVCVLDGGHLASIASQDELFAIKEVISSMKDIPSVWLGGEGGQEEGNWRWTDGSAWNDTIWDGGKGSNTSDCLQFDYQKNMMSNHICTNKYSFLCQNRNIRNTSGEQHQTFIFTTSSLPTPSLQFLFYKPDEIGVSTATNDSSEYEYDYASEWRKKRNTVELGTNMTKTPGFAISWFIRFSNGSKTRELPPEPEDWHPMRIKPKWRNPKLIETVGLVSKARENNISMQDLVKVAQTRKIESPNLCTGKTIQPCSYFTFHKWLEGLSDELGFPPGAPMSFTTEKDRAFGFELFSDLIHCSKERKEANQFVEDLLSENNIATLLLATVNTIQMDNAKDPSVWELFRDLYPILEEELGLVYGKILLATASTDELHTMLLRNWPYLDSFLHEVEECLRGDCSGVEDLIDGLKTSQAFSFLNPHLPSMNEPAQPFALIPFCAYQGDMSRLGQESHLKDLPVCSQFSYSIIEGELCYTLNVQTPKTKAGKGNGILLIIDALPVTPDPGLQQGRQAQAKNKIFDTKAATSSQEADLYLPTLESFRGRAKGSFSLTALKRITATKAFLDMKDFVRGCSLQNYEECQTEMLLKSSEEICGCLPWGLSPALGSKVRNTTTPPSHSSVLLASGQKVLHSFGIVML